MKYSLVSVIMPVYNCESYVEEAIQSILQQTYSEFEFIIINDGSTDNTREIIENQKDSRIQFINHCENQGNYVRRNEGNKIAKGKYIFVMDADDWAMPDRLELQIDTLECCPDLLACGTSNMEFDNTCNYRQTNPEFLKINLLFNNTFLHPSLAIRKDILTKINYYNEKFYYSADYDLCCRLALIGKLTNMPDLLMKYRRHQDQISTRHIKKQNEYADEIRLNYLKACGFNLNPLQQKIFTQFMHLYNTEPLTKVELIEICNNLIRQNNMLNYFQKNLFKSFLETTIVSYLNINRES